MKTAIIIAVIVSSIASVIESQSPAIPKQEVEQRPCKGKKRSIVAPAPNGGRIVGGVEAIPHSWPWMAYIECEYYNPSHILFEVKCGGSLILDKWIMTAAHCLNKPNLRVLKDCKILLGKHNLRKKEKTQLKPKIAAFFVHEKYVTSKPINGYDLALIKLKKPVKTTSAIQPISLPFGRPQLPFNKSCIGTGWGYTRFDVPKSSDKLMQLSMTVMDDMSCRNSAPPTPRPTDRVICATSWDINKDLCLGDSGGPLACKEADEKWYMRGVTSSVKPNCSLEAYFTKVAFFEAWITNIIDHN